MKKYSPPAPADLSEDSKRLWGGFVKDMQLVGRSTEVDFLLLGDLLRARDRLATVRERLDRDGLTLEGSKGQPRAHPLLAIEKALRAEVKQGLEELDLAPPRRPLYVVAGSTGRFKREEDEEDW